MSCGISKHLYSTIHYRPNHSLTHFPGYINMMLKGKMEASGFPDGCDTEQQKIDYVASIKIKDGIEMDTDKIEINEGLRSLMKIMLNSLWGRIGMNMLKTRIGITETMAEYDKIFGNPEIEPVSSVRTTPSKWFHLYKHKKDHIEANTKGSDIVAAFTTAHARLYLLQQLTRIGPNVCYYDTDSIIYSKKPGDPEIPIGSSLGEWANEIKHGVELTGFCSIGPKSYAGRLSDGTSLVKMKGVQWRFCNGEKLSYEGFKKMLTEGKKLSFDVPFHVERCLTTGTLQDVEQTRLIIQKYDKRIVLADYKTVPFGFRLPGWTMANFLPEL